MNHHLWETNCTQTTKQEYNWPSRHCTLSSHPCEMKSCKWIPVRTLRGSRGACVCVWWYRRELTRAQLHESQLEMRSSLTSGIFCVGSNLPAGHKTHTSQRDHRRQRVLQRTDDPLCYLKQEYFSGRSQETKSCSYRPCLLLLSFFSKIQSRPFFADLPFMFLNRHLQRDKKWPSSLFKIHLTVCVKLHPELKLWFWISCIDLDVTVKGRKSCLMGLWVRRHDNLCLISVGLLASSKQVWQNLH